MDWFELATAENIDSPGLVVDIDRVKSNIEKMIAIVGGNASRLRPHVKTHKMPAVTQLQLDAGIRRFKAATLAEAEMLAESGAEDILLAHQPVGPKIDRLLKLKSRFAGVRFATLVDNVSSVKMLGRAFADSSNPLAVYLDVECGMGRTGIELGAACERVVESVNAASGLQLAGLHVYDGHLHQPSLSERRAGAMEIIQQVSGYSKSFSNLEVVGGGSPTFGIWAAETDWQCSPGTTVFWDVGYGSNYPELDFQIAAALLTRVISKPRNGQVCFDLGYKAVSSEMDLARRVTFPEIPDAKLVGHSEEHLVVETSRASELSVGEATLAFPYHICPTVAAHSFATVVQWGNVTGESWWVTARDR